MNSYVTICIFINLVRELYMYSHVQILAKIYAFHA